MDVCSRNPFESVGWRGAVYSLSTTKPNTKQIVYLNCVTDVFQHISIGDNVFINTKWDTYVGRNRTEWLCLHRFLLSLCISNIHNSQIDLWRDLNIHRTEDDWYFVIVTWLHSNVNNYFLLDFILRSYRSQGVSVIISSPCNLYKSSQRQRIKQHPFLKSTHRRNTRRRAFHINRLLALHKMTFHLLFHFRSIDSKSSLQSPPNKKSNRNIHIVICTVGSTHTHINTHSPALYPTIQEKKIVINL